MIIDKFKGTSLTPFIFIILLIFLGIMSWNYLEGGIGNNKELSDASFMNMLRSEIESSKRFSKLSLTYSSDQAIYETALSGGICNSQEINGWICNTQAQKSFEKNKACLEKNTLAYVNNYVKNYTIDLPVDYKLEAFKNLSYEISLSEVMSGAYDEGNYEIYVDGSSMKLSSKGSKASEEITLDERVNKNRYWYLYRNFYSWAQDNVYSKEIQDCTVTCQGCECVEHAAEKALDDLKGRFDKFVECRMERICCVRGPSRLTGLLKGFSFWDQKSCISGCNLECNANSTVSAIDKTPFSSYTYAQTSNRIADNKLASVYEFSCTDNKYFVATGAGPKPLEFKVMATASFVDNGAC